MPLRFKMPGYAGNAVLLILAIVIVATGSPPTGILMGALALLNLYLIYKLDNLSQPEGWLTHELKIAKLKEELLGAQKRVAELEGQAAPQPSAQATNSPH